ncbi:MAG: hypothetical protein ACOVOV_03170 [Dolichospermum sp.]|jgi:hypothetical protein
MKINIPTTLQDITLNQFVEFQNSEQTNQDLVSIFCEIENTNLLQLKDFQEITEIVTTALNSNPNFYRRFIYKGVHYGFIPKLDNLSTAEYIDLEMYMAKPETFYKAMSILYRPVVKYKRNWFKKTDPFYDIAPYTGTNEIFKDAPSEYYLGACAFFFDLLNDCEKYMVDYSMSILKKSKQGRAYLMQNGDGMLASEL